MRFIIHECCFYGALDWLDSPGSDTPGHLGLTIGTLDCHNFFLQKIYTFQTENIGAVAPFYFFLVH